MPSQFSYGFHVISECILFQWTNDSRLKDIATDQIIIEEVEKALQSTASKFGARVFEFTVAPQLSPAGTTKPHHEWAIEFADSDFDLDAFAGFLDLEMQSANFHYKDLIKGKVIDPLRIIPVPKGGFSRHMKSLGKLGGQHKVPRVSNDREFISKLILSPINFEKKAFRS